MSQKNWFRRSLGILLALAILIALCGFAGAKSVIRMISPRAGETLRGEVLIEVKVDAPEVSYVIFGVDGDRPHATNSRPYGFLLDTTELSEGAHTLFAEVYSRSGLLGRSSPIRIYVKNGRARPSPASAEAAPEEEADTLAADASASPDEKSFVGALSSRAVDPVGEQASQPGVISAEPVPASNALSISRIQATAQPGIDATAESNTASRDSRAAPQITLNGDKIDLQIAPSIEKGRLQVGFREVLTADSWRINWLPTLKAGTATKHGKRLVVTYKERKALYNGRAFDLGSRAGIYKDRLIVPLRPICDVTGINIYWDQGTRTALLVSPETGTDEEMRASR